jgi:hypothetical protein
MVGEQNAGEEAALSIKLLPEKAQFDLSYFILYSLNEG